MGDQNQYEDLDLSDDELAALEEDDDEGNEDANQGGDDELETDDDADTDGGEAETDEDESGEDDTSGTDESGEGDAQVDGEAQGEDSSGSEDDADKTGAKEGEEDKAAPDDTTAGADTSGVDSPVTASDVFKADAAALEQKLDDGEIEYEEYEREKELLKEELHRGWSREEFQRQQLEQQWKAEQEEFFQGNDYLRGNPIVYDAFAKEVNRLLNDKAWANKPGEEVLTEAKKAIDSAFGTGKETAEPEKAQKGKKTPGKKSVDKAKKAGANRQSPKTLKDVPAADHNSDGAFDYLDDLEGAAFEKAIAKLTPEEMEAYENMT